MYIEVQDSILVHYNSQNPIMKMVSIESCGKFEFFHNYLWNCDFSYETEVVKGAHQIQIRVKSTAYVTVERICELGYWLLCNSNLNWAYENGKNDLNFI